MCFTTCMKRTALLSLLLSLVCAGSAKAAAPPNMDPFLSQAQAAFPNGPCAGKAQVAVTPNLAAWWTTNYGAINYEAGYEHAEITGLYSTAAPCILYVDDAIKDLGALCDVVVHEYGHSAGYDHSYKGTEGIMLYTDLTWSGCDKYRNTPVDLTRLGRLLTAKDAINAIKGKVRIRGIGRRLYCYSPSGPDASLDATWYCDVYARKDYRQVGDPVRRYRVIWSVKYQRVAIRREK